MLNRIFSSSVKAATLSKYSYRLEKFRSDPSAFYKTLREKISASNVLKNLPDNKKWILERLFDSIEDLENSKRSIPQLSELYSNLRDLNSESKCSELEDLIVIVGDLRRESLEAKPVSIRISQSDQQNRKYSTEAQKESDKIAELITIKDEEFVHTGLINAFGGVDFVRMLTDMAKNNGSGYECITCLRVLRKDIEDFSVLINAKTSIKVKDFSVFIDEILEAQNHLEKTGYIAGQVYKSFSVRVKDLKCQLDSQISSGSTGR